MFIAHAPAGYLLLRVLSTRLQYRLSLWLTGLFFSVAPDLDLIWFYAFSDRSIPHHQFVTHWPLFWLVLFWQRFCLGGCFASARLEAVLIGRFVLRDAAPASGQYCRGNPLVCPIFPHAD